MDLEERFKKEKGQEAEYTSRRHSIQYIWWLEHKVLNLEERLNKAVTVGAETERCETCGEQHIIRQKQLMEKQNENSYRKKIFTRSFRHGITKSKP